MNMIRKSIAAVAVLITASVVSLINAQPETTAPVTPPTTVVVTSTQVPVEGDAGWDCRQVTEHSNGVCGWELPAGFSVADIAECVDRARYKDCPAAVRERLGR